MASSAPRLLSADSHVLEPRDLWTSRIEPRFRDRAPRVVDEAGGLEGDIFVCEELRPTAVAGLGVAGVDPAEYPERMQGGYEGVRPSGWDPVARLGDQDRDGVSGEVLYTSLGMLLYGLKDGELRVCELPRLQRLAGGVLRPRAGPAGWYRADPDGRRAARRGRGRALCWHGAARRHDLGCAAAGAALSAPQLGSAVGGRPGA